MYSAGKGQCKHYDCSNRTSHGYCKTSVCINERYSQVSSFTLVHCCECKWLQWNMRQDGYLSIGATEYECLHWHGAVDPTDFCSHGERRVGG